MVTHLENVFQKNSRPRDLGWYRTGKRPDVKQFMRRQGEGGLRDDYMLRRSQRTKRKYKVTLLIDASGSMEKYSVDAARTTILLAEALSRLQIDTEIILFSDVAQVVKPFDEPITVEMRDAVARSLREQIGALGNGQTHDGDALKTALERLQGQDAERKFVFVVTDGQGNGPSKISDAIAEATAQRVHVVGVGIGAGMQQYVEANYPHHAVVEKIEDLPIVLKDELERYVVEQERAPAPSETFVPLTGAAKGSNAFPTASLGTAFIAVALAALFAGSAALVAVLALPPGWAAIIGAAILMNLRTALLNRTRSGNSRVAVGPRTEWTGHPEWARAQRALWRLTDRLGVPAQERPSLGLWTDSPQEPAAPTETNGPALSTLKALMTRHSEKLQALPGMSGWSVIIQGGQPTVMVSLQSGYSDEAWMERALLRLIPELVDYPIVVSRPSFNGWSRGVGIKEQSVVAIGEHWLSASEQALEGVLAHELGHLFTGEQRWNEVLRRLETAGLWSAAATAILAHVFLPGVPALIAAAWIVARLAHLAYRRRAELRADAFAAKLAGPDAARAFLEEALVQEPPSSEFAHLFTEHPSTAARLRALGALPVK